MLLGALLDEWMTPPVECEAYRDQPIDAYLESVKG